MHACIMHGMMHDAVTVSDNLNYVRAQWNMMSGLVEGGRQFPCRPK